MLFASHFHGGSEKRNANLLGALLKISNRFGAETQCIICSTTTREEYGYIYVLRHYEKLWMIAIMIQYIILNWSLKSDLLENDPYISFGMTAVKGTFFAFARVQSEKFHVVRVRLEGSNAHFLEGFLEQGFVFLWAVNGLIPLSG